MLWCHFCDQARAQGFGRNVITKPYYELEEKIAIKSSMSSLWGFGKSKNGEMQPLWTHYKFTMRCILQHVFTFPGHSFKLHIRRAEAYPCMFIHCARAQSLCSLSRARSVVLNIAISYWHQSRYPGIGVSGIKPRAIRSRALRLAPDNNLRTDPLMNFY
jgi:hypothetical protein